MWAIAIPLHVRVWRYAGALLLLAYSASAVQVTVSPGEDLEKKVALYPAGTTFVLASGIHRMQHATPKAGDVFIGEPGAVMNGALLLSTFRRKMSSPECDMGRTSILFSWNLFVSTRATSLMDRANPGLDF